MSQLNAPHELVERVAKSKPYEPYPGRNIDEMPKLIADGRTPMSMTGRIKRVLEVTADPERFTQAVVNEWVNRYVDTSDGSTCGGREGHLVVLDAQLLRGMNAKTPLYQGAIVLPNDGWDELKAQKESVLHLSADEVTEAQGKGYILKSNEWVPANRTVGKVWDHLGRGQNLTQYAQLVSKKSGGSENVMNLYFNPTTKDDEPTMRLWCVDRIDNRSNANGYYHLDGVSGRLVGVAPEAQARAENLDPQNGGPYRSPDAGSPNLENTLKTVFEVSQDYIPNVIKATYEAKIREALGKLF